jgi:hypothetical protein
MSAWEWVLQNWQSPEWKPIPQWVKESLHLHPAVGVCSGMFVTRKSAEGMNEFLARMNRKRG